jgi:hypothetical protein
VPRAEIPISARGAGVAAGAVRGAVNFPFWLLRIAFGLLCSKTIKQPVTTGAAQIVLAAAAVRSSRRMRRIP